MTSNIKIPFGSGQAKYIDRDGIRTLVVAIINSGDYGFTLSSEKIVIGGMPISLYFSESLGRYAIGIVGVSSTDDNLELPLSGHGLQTRITASINHTIELEQSSSDSPYGELIFAGFPISTTADDEIFTVAYTPLGSADETAETFISGIPILCHRYGTNWFLTAAIVYYSSYTEDVDPDFEWS